MKHISDHITEEYRMGKFVIECPVCHGYAEASIGFFA